MTPALSRVTRLPSPTRSLTELISARVKDQSERGSTDLSVAVGLGALCFYRATCPTRYRKTEVVGPRLIVIAQGRCVTSFSSGDATFDEDHLMVVTGETVFESRVSDATPDRPYLALCLELPPDVVARTLLALFDGAPQSSPSVAVEAALPAFVTPATEAVTSALARLIVATDEPLERKIVVPLAVEEIVFRLLCTEAAATIRGAVQEGDASIDTAIRYIRASHDRALTVEGIARHVGMSPSHFAHRFTAVARVSPMRFLKQVRLEQAREIMVTEKVRVQDVALRVGYESASHFTNDFKKRYGVSPVEYVRSVRSGESP